MVVDGFKCPDEFTLVLTPMEFEEMVNLFVMFDADKSGTIDKHEAKKILSHLGMDASIDRAEELLLMIDEDSGGTIDFNAFCKFIVLIKRGDERLVDFNSLIESINQTPLAALEQQAKIRGLDMEFHFVDKREASLTHPALFVVEVSLTALKLFSLSSINNDIALFSYT